MNKIHKTVWNASAGQWVVAPENAKTHGKSGSTLKAVCVLAFLAVPFTLAHAGVTDASGSSVSECNSENECNFSGTTISKALVEGAGSSGMGFLHVKNVTIDGNQASLPSPWPSLISLGGNNGPEPNSVGKENYGNLTLTVDSDVTVNKTNINQYDFSALYARSDTVGAIVTINSGANINLNRPGADGRRTEGILLETFGKTDANGVASSAVLNLTSGSNITVKSNNGYGAGVKVNGYGSALVNAHEGTSITTIGNNVSGMDVSSGYDSTGGKIDIFNMGSISTGGNNAHGILSKQVADNGTIVIDNRGSISTVGNEAHGIMSQVGANGTINIANSGTITTQGNEADAIHAVSAGAGDISVVNTANITTSGNNGKAIYASNGGRLNLGHGKVTVIDNGIGTTISSPERVILAEGNSAEVQSSSAIHINQTGGGTKATVGLDARATSSAEGEGYAKVTYNGAGVDMQSNGGNMIGIRATNYYLENAPISTGSSLVDASGNINLSLNAGGNADFLWGIESINYGAGDATILYHSGTINVTQQDGAAAKLASGLVAWAPKTSSSGNAKVVTDAGTAIHMKGTHDFVGIRAASQGTHADNKTVEVESHSTITTEGTNSFGIYANAYKDADITVHNYGNISTDGESAHAIHALSEKNSNIRVVNTGALQTVQNYATGIRALQKGNSSTNSLVSIDNTGAITTSGQSAHGIQSASALVSNSTSKINNQGSITTSGKWGYGINSVVGSNSTSEIHNQGNITTSGEAAHGILSQVGANITNSTINIINSGNIATQGKGSHALCASIGKGTDNIKTQIFQEGGKITTLGEDSHGVYVNSYITTGQIDVGLKNTTIELAGYNSDGVNLQQRGDDTNNPMPSHNVNVTVETSGGSIDTGSASAPKAAANFGIVVQQWKEAHGNINIINDGTRISTHLGGDGQSRSSSAIAAHFKDTPSTGNIRIANSGKLSTEGEIAYGIDAQHNGQGNISITNIGNISTLGKNAHGIYSTSTSGKTEVANTGAIATSGSNASGISLVSTSGDITLQTTGDITSADGRGIVISTTNGQASATVNGNITTGRVTATNNNHGIDVSSQTGGATVTYDHGTIQVSGQQAGGNTIGIAAWDGDSGNSGNVSTIMLGSNAIVDASRGVGGLQIRSDGQGNIVLDSGAQVHGGNSYGVQMASKGNFTTAYNLLNSGTIDAMNDRAILIDGAITGSTARIDNYGTVTGYISMGAEDSTFNNYSPNSLNLRNYFDSDGDGVRDTKGIAISDFGAGVDVFNNEANGVVRLAAVPGTPAIDAATQALEYIPNGALSITNPGTVHAQLLNLERFNNAGVIDLSQNGQAGDVLVITGGATAGANGGSTYVANGGTLKLDTVINEGGNITKSDVLVLDNAQLGSAPTAIQIVPMPDSSGGLTVGEGIKLVETKGTYEAGTFTLAEPVSFGTYEYRLYTGDTPETANNLYLRNHNTVGKVFFNINGGTYLANQSAAASMFNMNILDRRNSTRVSGDGLGHDNALWTRLNYSSWKTDLLDGQQNADIDTTVFQIGADLFRRDNIVAGLYAGYGHSSIDNDSNTSSSSGSGKVTGYHIGAYASLLTPEDSGPFVDVWGYYAWYDNKLSGTGYNNSETKYDSNGFALSAEAGYAIPLWQQASGTNWIAEPHAQIIYSDIDADDFTDHTGTKFSGNKASGIQTRIGARLYGQLPENRNGVTPFVEVNWLHNAMDNKVDLQGKQLSSDVGENVGEVKIGLQGQITNRVGIWGHLGAQKGSESYKRYEGQVGLSVQW